MRALMSGRERTLSATAVTRYWRAGLVAVSVVSDLRAQPPLESLAHLAKGGVSLTDREVGSRRHVREFWCHDAPFCQAC